MSKSSEVAVDKVYGRWKIVLQHPSGFNKSNSCIYWKCECIYCGFVRDMPTGEINRGNYRNCYCPKRLHIKVSQEGNQVKTYTITDKVQRVKGKVQWFARCECGLTRWIRADHIATGKVDTCECQKALRPKPEREKKVREDPRDKYLQYIGKTFNMLTITDILPAVDYYVQARAECSCGGITVLAAAHIISGKTKSCGCFKTENIVGNRYGKLVVLYRGINRDRRATWVCQCDCGKTKEIRSAGLKSGQILSCGCVSVDNARTMGLYYRGPLHPNYDITKTDLERQQGRLYHGYQQWRKEVFKRDNYKCLICGSAKDIKAHHMKPYSKFKGYRLITGNGITLCASCHDLLHKTIGINSYKMVDHHTYVAEAYINANT